MDLCEERQAGGPVGPQPEGIVADVEDPLPLLLRLEEAVLGTGEISTAEEEEPPFVDL